MSSANSRAPFPLRPLAISRKPHSADHLRGDPLSRVRGRGDGARRRGSSGVILRGVLNETFPLSGDSGIRVSKSARRSYFGFAPQGGGRWLGVVSDSRKTSDESSMRNARAIPIFWFARRC